MGSELLPLHLRPLLLLLGGAAAPPPLSGRRRSRLRRRPSRTAAVTLTCVSDDLTTAEVLRTVRQKIDLADLGIDNTSIRRAQTGGIVIAVPGADGSIKADLLAERMREALAPQADKVHVERPVQMAELCLYGVEDSVEPAEIQSAVALATACDPTNVRVGPLRFTRNMTTVWVQGPLAAANTLTNLGRLRLGWSIARVELLAARKLQCFRCLQPGHTRLRCTAFVDRSTQCYNCGETGHRARECHNPTRCSACADLGRDAAHRIGSQRCTAPVPTTRPRPRPHEESQSQVERRSPATDAMDVDVTRTS